MSNNVWNLPQHLGLNLNQGETMENDNIENDHQGEESSHEETIQPEQILVAGESDTNDEIPQDTEEAFLQSEVETFEDYQNVIIEKQASKRSCRKLTKYYMVIGLLSITTLLGCAAWFFQWRATEKVKDDLEERNSYYFMKGDKVTTNGDKLEKYSYKLINGEPFIYYNYNSETGNQCEKYMYIGTKEVTVEDMLTWFDLTYLDFDIGDEYTSYYFRNNSYDDEHAADGTIIVPNWFKSPIITKIIWQP